MVSIMLNKIKQISAYLLFSLISIVVYGLILYLVFSWLVGYSILHAYIGNLALIILTLAIDEYYMKKLMKSDELIIQMMKGEDSKKKYRSIQRGLNNVGSFKADVYLFYILILVFSQIIEYRPALVGESLGAFFHVNSYSILLLLAFDTLAGQYSKDRERMKTILDRIEKSLPETQDTEKRS